MTNSQGMRLNKFISDSGYCSRREADKLIEQNQVTINGKRPELGTKVQPDDKVMVGNKTINASAENKSDRVYIAYHKPIGITCTTERHIHGNIIDAIRHKERIFPIGRLDKPSEGLIFLTSDGDVVNKILRAGNNHEKEYIVTVDKAINENFANRMSQGIPILGEITKPCKVSLQSKNVFKIILTQGLNRQIRRMCEYLGFNVTKLKRTRIMNVSLSGLRVGQWRDLTAQEMSDINLAVAGSTKTADTRNKSIAVKKTEPTRQTTRKKNINSRSHTANQTKNERKLGGKNSQNRNPENKNKSKTNKQAQKNRSAAHKNKSSRPSPNNNPRARR